MLNIHSVQEFDNAVSLSNSRPILVFKHSTRCPISASAFRQVEAFSQSKMDAVYLVKVIEDRPLSNHVAATLGIEHASPQAIALFKGEPIWHASHYDITTDALHDLFAKY